MTHELNEQNKQVLEQVVGQGLCDKVNGWRELQVQRACSRREHGSFEKLGEGHTIVQA